MEETCAIVPSETEIKFGKSIDLLNRIRSVAERPVDTATIIEGGWKSSAEWSAEWNLSYSYTRALLRAAIKDGVMEAQKFISQCCSIRRPRMYYREVTKA